jgi:hypothetical protein
MGPDKANGEEERFVLMFLKKLNGFRSSLSIGMNIVISLGCNDDEGVAAHHWLSASRIAFERFTPPDCFPFRSLAIESLCP